ncbi:type I polyketide synthase [Achromobacter kerstersii]|uniref:type I polyketide synthase n=1 Tax=Achromobacter kerstersii TaxID=1353890 RepID=UPI0006C201E3|nr:type I polyketide synthase [Achromobacter kerstersii]CUI66711.1 Erythronolide synthase%2C modules 3 and 4 [Achromobacter kerstersii]
MAKRVAVIGLSFRFPSTTTDSYWPALLDGRNLVTRVAEDRWSADAYLHPGKEHPGTAYTFAAGSIGDVSGFDAGFFGISPREAALMDPQQRLLLEMSWEAIEQAGVRPSTLRGTNCGVYIGIASSDYAYRLAEDLNAVDASMATGNTASIAANRLSYFFDLRGPSIAMDTACSSSLVAFHQACRAIVSGECSQALAGGVSLHLHPYGFITFSKASMLSPRGRCNVFDAAGDGYVRSEGGGVFLLKDYDQAVADGDNILAVVAGSAVNTDGRKSGLTVPSADAQATLMRQAYEQAGISPADIDYLEAHGTGTAVGDPIETRAIGAALAQQRSKDAPLPIGSVKSNLGHLEAASGVAGLVKAMYVLRHRVVPATIGIKTLNPKIEFQNWNLDVVTQNRKLRQTGKLVVGVNSFGFGGANAHVILESAPPRSPASEGKMAKTAPIPVIVTGKSSQALKAAARQMADVLRGQPARFLYNAAYHAAMRRDWHGERAVVFGTQCNTVADLLEQFASDADTHHGVVAGTALNRAHGPVMVYSGNGSQWANMGRRLLADPVFATAIDEVDALFSQYADFSLHKELAGENGDDRYARTEIAQPALFALQVGITRMLAQRGVVPSAVIGHSVGEVAAAWACGALTLPDAVCVIFQRSRLQGQTKGHGRMTALGISGEEAQALIALHNLGDQLCVAGFNSSRGSTVAGSPDALTILEAALAEQALFFRRLDLDYAFHSPAMNPIEAGIRDALAQIQPRSGDIPFYSTVTGAPLDGAELTADYWWRNVREPVRFEQAANQLAAQGNNVFVEVGPHPVLRSYLNDTFKTADIQGRALSTSTRGGDDPEKIWNAAGQVIISGAQIDLQSLFPWEGPAVELPSYPWQRERHWHPTTPESLGLLSRRLVHPLLGYPMQQHDHTWENQLDTQSHPALADHIVGDAVVFPGTGFAEIALAAALQWQAGNCAELEELEIHAPLLLNASPSKLTRFLLDDSDGRFRITAKDTNSAEPWVKHASGRLLREPGLARLHQDLLTLPTRAPDFTGETHNALTRAVGLDYGPAFRAVSHGWQESDISVLAVLQAPSSLEAELGATHLHPALLDCAFQLIIQLLRNDPAMGQGIAFVPSKIGRLSLRANAGQPAAARVRLERRAPHSLTASFELFNAAGEQIAAVEQARFRSIRLRKPAADHLSFLDAVATPRPHAPFGPNPLDHDILHTALRDAIADCAQHGAHARYSEEVDPLLESLCDGFSLDALRQIAPDGLLLPQALITELCRHAPDSALLLQHTIARLTAAGYAEASAAGIHLPPKDESESGTSDIWNTLLREYPDYAQIVHAVGRVGLHLPALLRGEASLDDVCPRASTPASISRSALGAASGQRLGSALNAALTQAQTNRLPGQRLAVIEVGQAAPLFASSCCDALDFNVSDYCYASNNRDVLDHVVHQQSERYPNAQTEFIGEGGATATARCDLALFHCEFDTLEAARAALRHARASLRPGGVLLLCGAHPAAWGDFVFGARPSWWQTSEDGAQLSTQQPAEFWQEELQAMGLDCDSPMAFADSFASGAYLLTSRLGEHADAAPHTAAAIEPANWLILADRNPEHGAGLAQSLNDKLAALGHHVRIATEVDADALDELLRNGATGPVNHVVHLDGLAWADAHETPEELLAKQTRRCGLAAAVIQACERSQTSATVWLITADAAQYLCGKAVASAGMHALNDASLWGYGRTLANEASNFRIRLVDLPLAQAGLLTDSVVRELTHLDNEDEIILGATGARFAPRLQQAARPAQASDASRASQAIRLGFEFPGQLRNLRWESCPAPAPADDELEVRIEATGLNFRDVMYALGLLSDEAIENGFAGPTLGLEFSGTVIRVGADVDGYAVGDAVVGFGPASFGDRVLTKPSAISHIPDGFSFEAAATIPSTFFTVYYALHHLARLEEGEKILIHGAAGGVGIAAIQFAQWLGADIYATAGSDEKRDLLRLLGVRHIYDSRSLSYADEILADTDGRGVDVVLNSLAGEAINRNLRVLKPFGRFLELGKRDFYENTRIGLRPFRNNISYFGIDADQLMNERPDLTQRLFGEMMALFRQGALHPLPYSVFDANDIVDAFRYMQQARQIGKIVITYRNGISGVHAPVADVAPGLTLPADASYLVTGGLGGFGLRTAQWLVDKGARNLILISRSGPASEAAQSALSAFASQGVRVHAAACDVTDRDALARLLDDTAATLPPLKGVVHAAVVIDDGLARSTTPAQIQRTLAAKVLGAQHLHALTRELPLDLFVFYSSATTLFGNPGQSNYVAANTWLERLAAQRRAEGLPATCVRWGAIDDVGFLARNQKIKDALQGRMGGGALASETALDALEDMLVTDTSDLGVLELDWRALSRFLPTAGLPKFSDIACRAGSASEEDSGADDIAQMIATLDDVTLHERFTDMLKAEIGEILRVSPDKIESTRSVYDMGLDSLMGVELVVALENRFGIRLPVMALNESPTPAKLAERLVLLLRDEHSDDTQGDAVTASVQQVVASHAAEVGSTTVSAFVDEIKMNGSLPMQRMIQ